MHFRNQLRFVIHELVNVDTYGMHGNNNELQLKILWQMLFPEMHVNGGNDYNHIIQILCGMNRDRGLKCYIKNHWIEFQSDLFWVISREVANI